MSRRLTFRNLVSLLIMLNILMLVIVFNANIVGGAFSLLFVYTVVNYVSNW